MATSSYLLIVDEDGSIEATDGPFNFLDDDFGLEDAIIARLKETPFKYGEHGSRFLCLDIDEDPRVLPSISEFSEDFLGDLMEDAWELPGADDDDEDGEEEFSLSDLAEIQAMEDEA